MKHRNLILAFSLFFGGVLFFGCKSAETSPYNESETYRLWTELHSSKSVQNAESFFESIEQNDFGVFKIYMNFFQQSKNDKLLMIQYKQNLLELLRKYETSPSAELEKQIANVVNEIDILMIN